jgi:hypothetical protein
MDRTHSKSRVGRCIGGSAAAIPDADLKVRGESPVIPPT